MAWKETCPMGERKRFISEWLSREWTMTELCKSFGISRKTGYKWRERFSQEGLEGLADRSHAPHECPHTTPARTAKILEAARERHPTWGPRKLIAWLERKKPDLELPAPSTVGEILRRRGLVQARQRRRLSVPLSEPFSEATAPNEVWCGDFKGWFRTGDGVRCNPLTVSDACSRFLLVCRAVDKPDEAHCRPVLERMFREYGLPWRFRSDNGPPFGSTGLGGLTRLCVWLIRLGILPERITPGQPQENGRHERMHLTLQQDSTGVPMPNIRSQQREFDRFRKEFNHERPHEALGNKTPADVHVPSPRPYPERPPELEYPACFEVRSVHTAGQIRWLGRDVFVSEALVGERVGLEQRGEHHWAVHFGPLEVALISATGELLRHEKVRVAAKGRSIGTPGPVKR